MDAKQEPQINDKLDRDFGNDHGATRPRESGKAGEAALTSSTPAKEQVRVSQELDLAADAPATAKAAPALKGAFDKEALDRVAAVRATDRLDAEKALGLNAIERDLEKERSSSAQVTQAAAKASTPRERPATDNHVESDEIFTASTTDIKPVVPPEVEQRYLRVGDKFYHPQNTQMLAFEDKGNKLETSSNSENIAESMVRIAEARGWDEIKVTGSETFRKEVWLEAASRGMHVKGYAPTEQDKAELAKRVPENKIEKENETFRAREQEKTVDRDSRTESFAKDSPDVAIKKHPELAGAYAVMASVDKQAEADGLTLAQRAIVAARVRQNAENSIERGVIPHVTIKQDVEVKQERQAEREQAR